MDIMAIYECDGCGACCGAYLIFASTSDAAREPRIADEGRRLADHLATPQWTYQLHPLPFHSSCCFLDESNRCTIYERRPDVCRAFDAGGDQCQAARQRKGKPPLEPVGPEETLGPTESLPSSFTTDY
jgi:Fe-S-cluster containining protein